MAEQKHIVVLGAGFGGLNFTRKFRHSDARITIVDQWNHHLFQPLLYQVATAGLSMPDIAAPVRTIFSKRKDVRTVMDRVQRVDLEKKQVHLENGVLDYDYLVVGLGMVTSYFGNKHWADHTIGLKSLRDARRIRQRVLASFEHAEAIDDEELRRRLMTVVVIGGGPTGVEMAGALSELTKRIFRKDFRSIRPEESRIVLVEGLKRLLPTYAEDSSARTQRALEERGVEVILGELAKDIQSGRVELPSQTIEAGTIIWTAGVSASPIVAALPVEKDRRGRPTVNADTSLPDHPEVFIIGDNARFVGEDGKEVPGVSPAAIQMGQHVAKLLKKELKNGAPLAPHERPHFKYFDKGTMATIGRSSAVAELAGGKLRFGGFFAWALWLGVHLAFLVGFRNRIAVLLQWFYAYLRYRPAARVFEDSPETQFEHPRTKLREQGDEAQLSPLEADTTPARKPPEARASARP